MKFWKKLLSLLLVVAMLFNNFSPLVVMALDGENDDDDKVRSIAVDNIQSKGNIEVELHLALPIRNREETGIKFTLVDEKNNEATIDLNDMKNAQDGLYETTLQLGSKDGANSQSIRSLITKRDTNGQILSGEVVSDNIVYYSINLYSLNVGKYTIMLSGDNFVTYKYDVTLKDFSKRISISDEAGMFEIGDVNHDGKVDKDDETVMIEAIENNDVTKDLNLDDVVDIADLNYITAVMTSTKKKAKVEDTNIIMNSDNVSFELPEGTSLDENSDLGDLFTDTGTVTLKSEGTISSDNPVQLALDLGKSKDETVEMRQIRIGVGETNVPKKMKLLVVDENDEILEYLVDDTEQGIEGVHLFTDEDEGTIKVDLGKQVAVKKVTIVITETSTNNLAEIAKVEFLNNVKTETKQPDDFYTPQNIHVDDTKSEQLTVTFDNVPNVTGYEIKINGGKMNGVVFQTTFNTFTIEDLKNYVTYDIYVQSTNQEWRSGWSKAHPGTPKATSKAPKVDMVKATPTYGGIDFGWKAMDDTTSYRLYYREVGTSVYTLVDNIKGSSYSVRGLKSDTEYEAYVIGVNEIGESDSYTLVKATTKANGAAIVPKYKLINNGYDSETKKTTHIEEVHYHTGTMTNDNKYAMVDDDFTTYWQHKDWTISSNTNFNPGTPVFVLDDVYEMDEFVLTVPDSYGAVLKSGGPNSNDVKLHYWAEEHDVYDNTGRVEVKGTLLSKYDEKGRRYYLLKLEDPIKAKAVAFGLTVANNVKDIQIDEVKFYHYDSLVDDVAKLFTDDLRLELAPNVDQTTIDKLRERANTMDNGEYSPYKESVLADLDYAEKILKDEKIEDIITLNPNISNSYNNHVKFAMTISDYQPLGIVARPGEKLNVYVGTNGKVNAQIVFTQYHAEANAWNVPYTEKALQKGLNIIEVPKIGSSADERGGSVYIRYTSTPDVKNPIKVRVSGGTKIPMIDTTLIDDETKAKAAIKEYIETLEDYNSKLESVYANDNDPDTTFDKESSVLGSTEIVTKYGMFSVSSVAVGDALKSKASTIDDKVNTLYESMEAFDEMMELFYRQKGFSDAEDAAATDKMPRARINIRYMQMFYGAFMYAGGYHVGIEYGSIAGLVQAHRNREDATGYFGWGISHEVGHQINLKDTVFAEVTNNIYALLAQTSNDSDSSRLEIQGYDKIYDKVTSHTIGRAQNVFVQLGMYWQLHLAYDKNKTFEDKDSVYAKINKIARSYSNKDKNYGRDDLTILFASMAVEKDLTDFFETWGLVASEAVREEISGLGYEKETRSIYYLNDSARRYTLANKGQITDGANILEASIKDANSEEKRVTINLNLKSDSDKILGYEIKRNGVAIGFVENKEDVKEFVDNVGAENNRAYTYSVVAYDYYLNKINEVTLDEVKISHDGSVKKDAFTITSNVKAHNEKIDDEDVDMDYDKLEVNKLIDGNIETSFNGTEKIKKYNISGDKPTASDDNGNAYVIINLNNSMSVSGIKYRALVTNGVLDTNTINKYKIYVSATGADNSWTLAATGSFNTSANEPEKTVYFMKPGTDSEDQLWTYNGVNYIKIESDGNKNGLSGSEIDVIAPPGDNVDIEGEDGKPSIGVLKEDYCYSETESECSDGKNTIKADSVVIEGSYRGNPAFNAILIGDSLDDQKNYEGYEIIFANLNSDNSVYEVAKGTWLFVMTQDEYEKMIKESKSIRAYLYRVNDAITNDGQRLTSTSKAVSGMVSYSELPQLEITSKR